MNGFLTWMEKHFMPVAAKIGGQKHLVAIRDAFVSIMPVTMVGSIAVLLNVFLRDLPNTWFGTGNKFVQSVQQLININGNIYFGSIFVLGLVFTFCLGYQIANIYGVNPIAGGVVAFSAVVTTMNQSIMFDYVLPGVSASSLDALKSLGLNVGLSVDKTGVSLLGVSDSGYLSQSYIGASGIFTCLIVGFISSMIYVKLMLKKITIKLPSSVPPAVSNSFAAIIPGTIAIYTFGVITQICIATTGLYPNDLIVKWIQEPLLSLSQGFFSVVLIAFLIQLFWFFGLHGHNVLAPILEGIYSTASLRNLEHWNLFQTVNDMPFSWTRGSFDAYAQMGGAGATLGLLIAIFIFSKRNDVKTIAKLSAPMGVFNINEPIIFGLPIVLNTLYMIPWLIVPPICVAVAYLFTTVGIIPPVFVQVPWVMPVGVYAFFATGGNILAAGVAILNLFISFLIWTPFVLLANRMENKK